MYRQVILFLGSGLSLGYDPSIPNATHWTVDQVVLHFEEKGFEDEARVLREQVSASVLPMVG